MGAGYAEYADKIQDPWQRHHCQRTAGFCQIRSWPPAKPVVCSAPIRRWYQRALASAWRPDNRSTFSGCCLSSLFLAFSYRLTRERVRILYQAQLIYSLILFQLPFDVLLYHFLVSSHRIYIVSSAPEVTIPLFVFQICMLIKYHQRAFPFQIPHKIWYWYFWRYLD